MKKTLLSLLIAVPSLLHAQYWNGNTTQNNAVVGTLPGGSKGSLVTEKDQQNNVFIAWVDGRNSSTTGDDIYIQKISKDGSMAWAANGIPVCTANGAQSAPSITSDGNDGVIVTWVDGRGTNTQIYTQRFDANGNAIYTNNGVQLVSSGANQTAPAIKLVNSTEAMIFFRDARNSGAGTDLFIHKININNGAAVWANDVNVVAASNNQTAQSILPDGSGGAYLAWGDPRISTSDSDIYVQRISNSGTILWTSNGLNITSGAAANQIKPSMALDGANGFFIAWQDLRNGSTNADIYAQKVKPDGSVTWTSGGIATVNATGSQDLPQVISDGNNGAIITWMDPRDLTTGRRIFAQRLNDSGVAQWVSNGVPTANGQIVSSTVVYTLVKGQTAGTAVIVWQDTRNTATSGNDIYAQKLNDDGSRAWADAGLIVCNANGAQANPVAETDGADNIIAAWTDSRSGTTNAEIYTSNVLSTGVLPVTYIGIQARRSISSVVVTWDVASEINTVKYLIERSADGSKFVAIASQQASKKSKYTFADVNPLPGNNYYRVVGVDTDGTLSYSDVAQATFNLTVNEVQVYPNPVMNELKIKLNPINTDKLYNFTLTDITGKIQFNASVDGKGLQDGYPINVSNLSKGMYFLTIKQGSEKVSYPVIKN
jgi:hypothetical protein